ncbi:integrin beta-7 isoform X2 [Hypanus sabinus]|uniref:integrin beta-7 isoform X2 n=1 Tax=Hypanus sabinus TaxID=79690 RepID=UPI0028C4CFFB|nr:integrin beta-7 isoform X2 [Hypanus sabinus]
MPPVWVWVPITLLLWDPDPSGCGSGKLAAGAPPCGSHASCDDCISAHPSCSWCKYKSFTKPGEPDSVRCDGKESLQIRGCPVDEIINPNSSHEVLENRKLGQPVQGEGHVQLAPQKIRIKIRPGWTEHFVVKFRRAERYPVDLYYLMDLSYSMKDDLEYIRNLGSNLLFTLTNIADSVRIGFGSFVDKTTLPFTSLLPHRLRNPCPDRSEQCQPPFSFRNVLPLTQEEGRFEEEVGRQQVSGNLDTPEGGLDAMMQAVVCEEVGWRNVTKLLVYTSDATFHSAGDGRLGGIFLPNDARCHLDETGLYTDSNLYDYPSVGQLVQTLSKHNVQPIFAVTQNVVPVYQNLSKLIPKSAVGELKADSSNVLQLISEAYNNLSSTVKLEHSKLPEGISLTFQSHCGGGKLFRKDPGECLGVRFNQEVNFTVGVTASRCLPAGTRFALRVLGFTEKLEVAVETECTCHCGDADGGDAHCSHGNGTLNCGQCSCLPGRVGRLCECTQDEDQLEDLLAPCRKGNESALCEGRGQCVCGKCVCDGNLRGQYCECDDSSCIRKNGLLCSGHGSCTCGKCNCDAGYEGEACHCPQSEEECRDMNGSICAGHGDCRCGQCICHGRYIGPTCNKCPNCQTPCQRHKDCVECQVFGTGYLADNCTMSCQNVTVSVVKQLPKLSLRCVERSSDGRLLEYVVQETESGQLVLFRDIEAEAPERLAIVGGLMTGIVLVGLLILLVWRGATELRDRKEYQHFTKEKERAQWDSLHNPLYKSATTTTVNPQFLPD